MNDVVREHNHHGSGGPMLVGLYCELVAGLLRNQQSSVTLIGTSST